MNYRALLLSCLGSLIALSASIAAPQTNHWRAFTTADGLLENSCTFVTPGVGGNILVRHSKSVAVSIFDGYEITTIPSPGTNRGRIYESPSGQLWTVTRDGLLEFRDGEWSPHPVPQIAAHFVSGRTNEIRLQPVRQGRVLIFLPDESLQLDASDPEHPYVEPTAQTNQTVSANSSVALPELFSVRRIFETQVETGGAIWFATTDGLFREAPEIWENTSPPPRAEASFDTAGTLDLPDHIRAHGVWKSHLTAKNGDLWLGGAHEIAWRHLSSWRFFSSTNQIGPEDVIGFAESPDGRISCGTPHKVWEFDGKDWLTFRSGFERINKLHCSRDGTLWVATSKGLFRFTQGAWIANDTQDGLPSADIRDVREESASSITVETARGFSAFHPRADVDAPRTFIVSAEKENVQFREGAVVSLAFRGRDKWKQTAPMRLLFSFRLDEREWSPFSELNEITLTDLPLGKHYFQARAMDRNGNIDPKPARLEFSIVVPWYRETRLILVLTVALAVAIFFATLAFNRHHKLQRSYVEVERQIAERTRELELANRELLHSQKMNALGSLAAGIAHDFNNILSIIKGSAQIIEDNADNPDKIRTRVDRIKTVVQQGAEVVDAMLGFSRSTDQPPAPCDLNAVVDETRKLLGDRFLRETEVRFERGENLPEVSVAKDFVQQILLNFIFNAAEAMERRPRARLEGDEASKRADSESGAPKTATRSRHRITLVTSSTSALPEELVLKPVSAAGFVLISVRDCGSGIAPEIKSRIFEPFFTTKALSTKRGTGLGLSMVYELAKKMEAGLAVESTVGHGSTFTLILPVRESTTTP